MIKYPFSDTNLFPSSTITTLVKGSESLDRVDTPASTDAKYLELPTKCLSTVSQKLDGSNCKIALKKNVLGEFMCCLMTRNGAVLGCGSTNWYLMDELVENYSIRPIIYCGHNMSLYLKTCYDALKGIYADLSEDIQHESLVVVFCVEVGNPEGMNPMACVGLNETFSNKHVPALFQVVVMNDNTVTHRFAAHQELRSLCARYHLPTVPLVHIFEPSTDNITVWSDLSARLLEINKVECRCEGFMVAYQRPYKTVYPVTGLPQYEDPLTLLSVKFKMVHHLIPNVIKAQENNFEGKELVELLRSESNVTRQYWIACAYVFFAGRADPAKKVIQTNPKPILKEEKKTEHTEKSIKDELFEIKSRTNFQSLKEFRLAVLTAKGRENMQLYGKHIDWVYNNCLC